MPGKLHTQIQSFTKFPECKPVSPCSDEHIRISPRLWKLFFRAVECNNLPDWCKKSPWLHGPNVGSSAILFVVFTSKAWAKRRTFAEPNSNVFESTRQECDVCHRIVQLSHTRQSLPCYTAVPNFNTKFARNVALLSGLIPNFTTVSVRHNKSATFSEGLSFKLQCPKFGRDCFLIWQTENIH